MNIESGPNTGPAPAPSRELALEFPGNSADGSVEVDPATLTVNPGPPEPRIPGVQTSPAPQNPVQAEQESATEKRIGELIQAMGDQNARHQRQMEEMQLKYETQSALAMGAPNVQLPENFDPEATVKAGDLFNIMTRTDSVIRETVIRNTWDVTPEEESAILQSNPQIAQIQDGAKRAELVKRAASLLRQNKSNNGEVKEGTSQTSTDTKAKKAPEMRPISKRVVPHSEGSTTPKAEDFSPTNPSTEVMSAYKAAQQIPDKKERLAAMKQVFKNAQHKAGITDEALSHSAFKSS
jgi:hypothetical protein